MAEPKTVIHLRNSVWSGYAEMAHANTPDMIAKARAHAKHLRAQADDVDAAADADFTIYQCRGVHVEREMTVLQKGRPV